VTVAVAARGRRSRIGRNATDQERTLWEVGWGNGFSSGNANSPRFQRSSRTVAKAPSGGGQLEIFRENAGKFRVRIGLCKMDDSQDLPEREKALPASPDHTRPEPLRSQLPDRASVTPMRAVHPPTPKPVTASAVGASGEPDPVRVPVDVSHSHSPQPAARIDYKGADLRKADLRKFALAGADFTGADLTAANLSGCDLTGANFTRANLSSLPETLPGEQDSFPAWGRLTDLGQANLDGANLAEANLIEAHFGEASLRGADLRGANLTRAGFHRANLSGANLTEANLTRASLSGANLTGANLNDSTLNDAHLGGANFESAQLRGARIRRADLSYVNLKKADLGGAQLRGSYLVRSNLHDAYLSGASLRDCYLFAANLRNADLRRTDARNATFDSAWLVGANLEYADLRGATFSKSWLLETNLQRTKTSGSGLQDARCSPTTVFPTRLHYLRRSWTMFSVKKAGAWARFRGVGYGVRENADARLPVVVLRCVGEATAWGSHDGVAIVPFAELISEWTELLTKMDVFCEQMTRVVSIDGFEAWQSGHSAVIAIGVSSPAMPIMATVLKASSPIPRTIDELLERAEAARASVTMMLQRLAHFIGKDPSRLSETTASDFFASCINAIWKLRVRGGDVVLIDSVRDAGPDEAAKIIREARRAV